MREKRTFAERTKVLKSDEVKKKYFLVFEGSDTEVIYFDMVNSMKAEIGLNSLIELVPIIRSFSEEGWSNPKKILDRIIKDLEEDDSGKISIETFLNWIMDYLRETDSIANDRRVRNTIWEMMKQVCENEFEKTLEDKVKNVEIIGNKILEKIEENYLIENLVSKLSDIIEHGGWSYEKGFDEICLIVDRDKESFISKPGNDQYNYVLDRCLENGFRFCVTNPCFEFWLLMHSDKVLELDKDKLLNNSKVTSKRRYAEDELRKIYSGYKKSSYHAEEFVKNIDIAIKNEKEFCEDIQRLKDSIGSNIGILIEDMRS